MVGVVVGFAESAVDQVDLEILRRLVRNSRATYTDLSGELRVATSTVLNRVQKLERSGVIEQFTVLVNPERVGKTITTFLGIQVEAGHRERVVEELKRIGDVVELYELLEPYDLLVKVRTDNVNTLKENVLRVLSGLEGVRDFSTLLTTRRHKEVTCHL